MPKFKIISQFLKDMSFESPNVPELFFNQESNPAKLEINIDIPVKSAENNVFMVDLVTKVHSKLDKDAKTIFLIETTYSAVVQLDEGMEEEDKRRTLMIDVPALVFPAWRSLITRLTAESGFPPFVMQPVDFAEMYEQRKNSAQQQKPANQ